MTSKYAGSLGTPVTCKIHLPFVTPVTGLNKPNAGKEDDDDGPGRVVL
jgi:hypothetical protein